MPIRKGYLVLYMTTCDTAHGSFYSTKESAVFGYEEAKRTLVKLIKTALQNTAGLKYHEKSVESGQELLITGQDYSTTGFVLIQKTNMYLVRRSRRKRKKHKKYKNCVKKHSNKTRN